MRDKKERQSDQPTDAAKAFANALYTATPIGHGAFEGVTYDKAMRLFTEHCARQTERLRERISQLEPLPSGIYQIQLEHARHDIRKREEANLALLADRDQLQEQTERLREALEKAQRLLGPCKVVLKIGRYHMCEGLNYRDCCDACRDGERPAKVCNKPRPCPDHDEAALAGKEPSRG